MKSCFLLITAVLLHLLCTGQKLNSGTYTFKYCDLEYNLCLGSCRVVIKGDSITIYATKELAEHVTHTREGDILNQGIILKHKSGKWILGRSRKDINAKEIGADGPPILDFVKKQYWTY